MKIDGWPEFRLSKSKPGRFILTKGFTVINGDKKATIPEGLIVNGASIPKPLTLIFDRWHPDYNRASIMHDALVGEFDQVKIYVVDDSGEKRQLSWKESALWFKEAMNHEGSPKYKRKVFYHAVMRFKDAQRLFRS